MAEGEAAQMHQQQGLQLMLDFRIHQDFFSKYEVNINKCLGNADEMAEVEGQVIQIDAEQLAQLLAQSADGTAQILDEEGNTITVF